MGQRILPTRRRPVSLFPVPRAVRAPAIRLRHRPLRCEPLEDRRLLSVDFADVRVANLVDQDYDGYAGALDIEFDVDSDTSGDFYVKIYQSMPLFDYLVATTPTYHVEGSVPDFHAQPVTGDEVAGLWLLGQGTVEEFRLDLFDAASNQRIVTWDGGDDPDLAADVDMEWGCEDATLSVENLTVLGTAISGYGGLEVSFDLVNNTSYTVVGYLPEVRISTDSVWDDGDLAMNWDPDEGWWNSVAPGERRRVSNVLGLPEGIPEGSTRYILAAGVRDRLLTTDERGPAAAQEVTVADELLVIPAVPPQPGDIVYMTGYLGWTLTEALRLFGGEAITQDPVGSDHEPLLNQFANWLPGHSGLVVPYSLVPQEYTEGVPNAEDKVWVFESQVHLLESPTVLFVQGPEFTWYDHVDQFGNRGNEYEQFMGVRTLDGGLASMPGEDWFAEADAANYATTSFLGLLAGYGLGSGELSKGPEQYTCVGLTEVPYEMAGQDLVAYADEEAWPVALSPHKQWRRTEPRLDLTVTAGQTVEFAVYGIYHGQYISSDGDEDTGELQADLSGLIGGAASFAYDPEWQASLQTDMHAKVLRWEVPPEAGGDYTVTFTGARNGVTTQETVTIHVEPAPLPADAIGLYDPAGSLFFQSDSLEAGNADRQFAYGPGGLGWQPLSGDWNNDDADSAGLYDPGIAAFFLRDSNDGGIADIAFHYGPTGLGWLPLAGDWNGDGADTVGLYDPGSGTFFLRDSNTAGIADAAFGYGPAGLGWLPLVGDWDGDGADTVGLFDPESGVFFLRNSNAAGVADATFGYGPGGSGWLPLVGDWDSDGDDTIGLYDPAGSAFFLRNSNLGGVADAAFAFGLPAGGWLPIAGDWTAGAPLLAAAAGTHHAPRDVSLTRSVRSTDVSLTRAALQPLVDQALADWAGVGLAADQLRRLTEIDFIVADLPGAQLGWAVEDRVYLDLDAAGRGWFIDPTPGADEEFAPKGREGGLRAVDPRAIDRVDLLTVVSHELGHSLGMADLDPASGELMSGELETGLRREIGPAEIDWLLGRSA